jgi:hypothetical protein
MIKLGNIASFTNIDGTTVTGIIENWVVNSNMLTILNIGG